MENYEIEIKYLLRDLENKDYSTNFFKEYFNSIKDLEKKIKNSGDYYEQYYLDNELAKFEAKKFEIKNYNEYNTLRVRSIKSEEKELEYILTFKGKSSNYKNLETEFEISKNQFEKYIEKSISNISKKRLVINYPQNPNLKIEFDLFINNKNNKLNNLILAEIEVENENEIEYLKSLGIDVSSKYNYSNKYLAKLNKL